MKTLVGRTVLGFAARENTVIGVVATNARLSKEQANKVAQMAQDGVARAIRPAHTMLDGDTIFRPLHRAQTSRCQHRRAFAAEALSRPSAPVHHSSLKRGSPGTGGLAQTLPTGLINLPTSMTFLFRSRRKIEQVNSPPPSSPGEPIRRLLPLMAVVRRWKSSGSPPSSTGMILSRYIQSVPSRSKT